MVDTPTSEYGLRQQALGENVNTWGDDKLNQVIRGIAQIIGKTKDIAITGDYTITSTDYVTTADNKNAGWRFTGTLTANAIITVPASSARFFAINDTTGGYSLTIKTSAGTGISVPNGRTAMLRCNGVNVLNNFPTHMGTDFTPVLVGDVANVNYVITAIAAASGLTAPFILVDGSDTTPGYLIQKVNVAASGDIAAAWGVENPGADENALLSITGTPYWNTPRNLAFADSPITALDRDVIELNTSGGAITINLPASGRVWIADKSGNAAANNVTLVPAGSDTVTFGTLDVAYFGVVMRKNSTNWDLN